MRVVINGLAALKPKTGIGHHVVNLAAALKHEYPDDEFWLYPGDRLGRIIRSFNKSPTGGNPTPANTKTHSFASPIVRSLKQAAKSLSQNHFSALTQMSRFSLYHEPNFVPFHSQIPTIVTIHDLSVLHFPDWHPADRVRLHTRRFTEGVLRAAHVITVSEFVRNEVIAKLGVAANRVTAVLNGVSPAFRPHTESEVQPVRNRLGLPTQYLLAVGTIEPRKNLLSVMRAFVDLPTSVRSECPLVLVGPWGWKSEGDRHYFEAIGRHHGIQHLGYISDEDLPAVYAGASGLVYSSHYEGFGLPPVEMLACGGAVVASSLEVLREICGPHCEYIEPENITAWSQAMLRLVTDHSYREELRRGGIEQAARYSWSRAARETMAVYRQVLDQKDASASPPS